MSGGLRALLAGPLLEAAPGLLGCTLTSRFAGEETSVVITEVEAYGGADDPASHAHRGPTGRNAAMFGPPGTLYVYRSYGAHWCLNVVTGPEGVPSAVLVRGGRPVAGREVMERRRGRADRLADGPGKLAQAMAVTGDHDGSSVLDGPVMLGSGEQEPGEVRRTPRIGISKAAGREWRFLLEAPLRG